MASTGSSSPTMRPTSRAQRPPALTTCSACTVPCSVTTFQAPVGLLGQLDDAVAEHDRGAELLRRLGVGVGGAGGVEVPLDRVPERADEMRWVDQREHRRRLGGGDDLECPCRGSGPWHGRGAGSPCARGCRRASPRRSGAGRRTGPTAPRARGRARRYRPAAWRRWGRRSGYGSRRPRARTSPRSARSARSASRRSSRPGRGGRAPSSRRRRRRSPRRAPATSCRPPRPRPAPRPAATPGRPARR